MNPIVIRVYAVRALYGVRATNRTKTTTAKGLSWDEKTATHNMTKKLTGGSAGKVVLVDLLLGQRLLWFEGAVLVEVVLVCLLLAGPAALARAALNQQGRQRNRTVSRPRRPFGSRSISEVACPHRPPQPPCVAHRSKRQHHREGQGRSCRSPVGAAGAAIVGEHRSPASSVRRPAALPQGED
eukprot:scaffold112581_cov63-Phaeocystis_antarctica.AAC.1